MSLEQPPTSGLGNISHRLRNPVAGIRTTAQVLLGRFNQRDDVPDSWVELVNRILKETYNMESAINAMEKGAQPSGSRAGDDEPTGAD